MTQSPTPPTAPLPPYIYGREAGPNEKVWTQEAVNALRSENERLQSEVTRLLGSWTSAVANYGIQKRERERLEVELSNCESRIRGQRAEITRLAALHADQARDARIQALEEAAKVMRQAREILIPLRNSRQLNPYGLLGQYGDKAWDAVTAINAWLESKATQPVPGGKELP